MLQASVKRLVWKHACRCTHDDTHSHKKKKKSERGVAIRGIFFILYTSRSMGHFLFLTDFVSFCIFLWDANAAQSGSRIEQISNPSTKLELYVICV